MVAAHAHYVDRQATMAAIAEVARALLPYVCLAVLWWLAGYDDD